MLKGEHAPSARKRRRIFGWILRGFLVAALLVLAAVLILVVPSAGALRTVHAEAEAGRESLYRARDAAARLEFRLASAELSDAVIAFETAYEASFRLGLLGRTPLFRAEVVAVRELLSGARNAAIALREAVDIGADILSVLQLGLDPSGGLPSVAGDARRISELGAAERRLLLQKMAEAPDRLGMARAALDDAFAAFDRIPRTPLTEPVLASIEPQMEQLRELRGALDRDLSLLGQVPAMLGYPRPKIYLFLMLNNTELRPGGGFIGTYGTVRLADGAIDAFETDDIYALDGPAEAFLDVEPPEPLRRWLRADRWFLRDANWSPDYAVSSMNVERFYALENGPHANELDGIIGVTPTVIERLLELTGPITVDGTTFTSANVTDELEYQVEIGFVREGIPLAQRKEIVGALGEALVDRLLSLPLSELQTLYAVFEAAVRERHVMVVFKDPGLQAVADAHDWSGRMWMKGGDELLVVDANLAALKTDPAVERTVAYSIRPDGGGFIARAEMTYRHRGTFNWKTTRYRTYTRFYAPLGAELLRGEGAMMDDRLNDPARRSGSFDVGEELGRTVFGAFISIEPGETRRLAVEYRLPPRVADMVRSGRYELEVRKQLGTIAHGLTLDLDFDKNVRRASPPEEPGQWGDDRYVVSTDLRVDRRIVVELQ